MKQAVNGFAYFIDGFGLIFKPGLKRYVIIPLLINIFIFAALFFLMRHFVGQFNHWFAAHLPHWLQWLSTIIWFIFFCAYFLLYIYLFVTIANIVSAPFNSLLAEQVQLYLTGAVPEQRSWYDNVKDIPRILGRQLAIIAYYLPRALVLLLLFFIPVVQAAAAICWFLFNAWFMTLTYVDYPTDNNRVSMRDMRDWLGQHRWLSLGFGVSVLLATMIPVVNCFTIPAAVAGATKLWIRSHQQ